MPLTTTGEARGQSSESVDHTLPGDPRGTGVCDPADLSRTMTPSGQQGDLPVRDHTASGDRADDGKDSGAEEITSLRSQ